MQETFIFFNRFVSKSIKTTTITENQYSLILENSMQVGTPALKKKKIEMYYIDIAQHYGTSKAKRGTEREIAEEKKIEMECTTNDKFINSHITIII